MCMMGLAMWVPASLVAGISPVAGGGHRRVAAGDFHEDKDGGNFRRWILLCVFIFFMVGIVSPARADGQTDWAAEYSRLSQIIEERKPEPRGNPRTLEPYLRWMEIKASDRDEVDALLQQLNMLGIQNPGNQQIAQWTQKFFELRTKAQASGDGTVWEATNKIMRWGHGTMNDSWLAAIIELYDKGRQIYLKAQATRFDTHVVRKHARCMVRFSTADIETGNLSIWFDREAFLGSRDAQGFDHDPIGDFAAECTLRADQTVTAEGRPAFPMDEAFEKTKMIRDEAEWWQFEPERQDVIDLENDYYKDALCQIPPHKSKEGHKYFLDLAKEKELDDSIEYNEGFYATLYGKVEVLLDGVREPAAGAKVTVEDLDETWTVTADAQGNYEIKDAILHKECSPFDIRAVHDGDWVEEKYDGILEEPDKGARHRVDLLIRPKPRYKWYGNITFTNWERFTCAEEFNTDVISGFWKKERDILQRGNVHLNLKNVDMAGPGTFHLGPGDMIASGSVTGKYKSRLERELHQKQMNENEHISQNDEGMKSFPITDQNLMIQIVNENLTDGDKFESMAKDIMAGGFDPEAIEAMTKKLEQMMGAGQRSIPVRVQIQFIGDWQGMLKGKKYKQYPDHRKGSKGRTIIERESYSTKISLVTSPSFELKGTYTRGKKGNDQLQASYQESRTLPSTEDSPGFASRYREFHNLPPQDLKCPGRKVTSNASFSLTRKRVK